MYNVGRDGVAAQRGGAAAYAQTATLAVSDIGGDDVVIECGVAVVQEQPASEIGCVAEHLAVAESGCGCNDEYSTTTSHSWAKSLCIAAGDAQPLNSGGDVPTYEEHTTLLLGIQRGQIGVGVGRRPVGGSVAASDGDCLADVNYLGDTIPRLHAGIVAGRHLDDIVVLSGVHSGLHRRVSAPTGADL